MSYNHHPPTIADHRTPFHPIVLVQANNYQHNTQHATCNAPHAIQNNATAHYTLCFILQRLVWQLVVPVDTLLSDVVRRN